MNKQIDFITDLLIDFDEMGFAPTTTVPDPDAYAIEWRNKLTDALQGYRKASDVVAEIEILINGVFDVLCEELEFEAKWGAENALGTVLNLIASLKKKYESENNNG